MTPNIDDGLWVTGTCQCRFTDGNGQPLGWGMVMVGEAAPAWDRGPVGTLCPFLSILL